MIDLKPIKRRRVYSFRKGVCIRSRYVHIIRSANVPRRAGLSPILSVVNFEIRRSSPDIKPEAIDLPSPGVLHRKVHLSAWFPGAISYEGLGWGLIAIMLLRDHPQQPRAHVSDEAVTDAGSGKYAVVSSIHTHSHQSPGSQPPLSMCCA